MYEVIVIDGPKRGYIWKTEELRSYFVMANDYPDPGYTSLRVIDCDGVYVAKVDGPVHVAVQDGS